MMKTAKQMKKNVYLQKVLKEYNFDDESLIKFATYQAEEIAKARKVNNKNIEEYFIKQKKYIDNFYDLLIKIINLQFTMKTNQFKTMERLKINADIINIQKDMKYVIDNFTLATQKISQTEGFTDTGIYLTENGLVLTNGMACY